MRRRPDQTTSRDLRPSGSVERLRDQFGETLVHRTNFHGVSGLRWLSWNQSDALVDDTARPARTGMAKAFGCQGTRWVEPSADAHKLHTTTRRRAYLTYRTLKVAPRSTLRDGRLERLGEVVT